MAREAYAAKQLFAASMSMTGSPAASWRSEGAMVVRGAMARERRRKAEVRQRLEEEQSKRRRGLRELEVPEVEEKKE